MRNSFFIAIACLCVCIQGCSIRKEENKQHILLWFDASANFERLSYADSIRFYLDKCKEVGVTDAVVDIRPITGYVLYQSNFVPQLTEWGGSKKVVDSLGQGKYVLKSTLFKRDAAFNMLQVFIDEGHKRNIRIQASLNMFVGGHNYVDRGIVYEDHPEWQSINYTPNGMQPITEQKHKYSAMMNPVNPEVRAYLVDILKEVCEKYPKLDGVIIDRGRFDGIEADFSDLSRKAFEKYIGKELDRFPEDIYEWVGGKEKPEIKRGMYFKEWLEFRAMVIHDFFYEARQAVKAVNPDISFGDYTGAWYSSYYDVGVNWASKTYDPSADYEWATPSYQKTGYAESLDLFTVGCYFYEVTRAEADGKNIVRTEAGMRTTANPENTVEGSAELAMKVTKGVVPVYGGLLVDQYTNDPQQFIKTCRMARLKTNGLMVFDVCHIIQMGWWEHLKESIDEF